MMKTDQSLLNRWYVICIILFYPLLSLSQEEASKVSSGVSDDTFMDQRSTARFLTQATFGPSMAQISALTGSSASKWLVNEFNKPISLNMPIVRNLLQLVSEDIPNSLIPATTTISFWRNAISADDQLRQRVAFALSEILVVSNDGGDLLFDVPQAVGNHQDILTRNAFGNYRDLLEEVTYSPGMGFYLTYMGNKKADPITGSVPDENYAREILQLFTVGLIKLNKDGSAVTDGMGQPIELYNNTDITGLAKVFTGLNLAEPIDPDNDRESYAMPMTIIEDDHSTAQKNFLDFTIPANTTAANSIDMALDHIMMHPNVGPFIGKQLIQRLVTSNPSPAYIERVANAFDSGVYLLPNGQSVGEGRLGDLKSTVAAILFDQEARSAKSAAADNFGKVREPIVIFSHWARAFNAMQIAPEVILKLWETNGFEALSQHPYRPKSVFNFFRPGYVPPGTVSANAGLMVPEMQIVSAASIPGYINFMLDFISGVKFDEEFEELAAEFMDANINLDPEQYYNSFLPDYTEELLLASQPEMLIERLAMVLTSGQLSTGSKARIATFLNAIPLNDTGAYIFGPEERVRFAIMLIMSSPDYLIQR